MDVCLSEKVPTPDLYHLLPPDNQDIEGRIKQHAYFSPCVFNTFISQTFVLASIQTEGRGWLHLCVIIWIISLLNLPNSIN